MRRRLLHSAGLILLALITGNAAHSQVRFERAGLAGRTVYSLAQWGEKIYAGTDDGVYVHLRSEPEDTVWIPSGLQGKRVRAVYPHQSGAIGYAVTAGLEHRPGDPDSVLIYCSQYSDSAWMAADEGIDRSLVRMIRSIDGFPSPLICGETYAASEGLVFRREIGGIWQKVFDLGISTTNVVRVDATTVSVWVGGETTIFAPFISRSDDKGESWFTAYPDLQGDNACDALAFHPLDTSVVYAGMEGSVILSRDGGKSWESAGLSGTPFYFFGLLTDAVSRVVIAGGAAQGNVAGLYVGFLGDTLWAEQIPPEPFSGIRTMLCLDAPASSLRILLGTEGDGVIRFTFSPCAADNNSSLPGFCLHQNYPNPFNPKTTIEYTVPRASNLTVRVYDVLGREIVLLASGRHQARRHRATWDASGMPAGVYFARLTAEGYTRTAKMLLSR